LLVEKFNNDLRDS
jgi:hypothetical protein